MSPGFLFVTYPTPTTISWGRSITNRIGSPHDQDSSHGESGSYRDASSNPSEPDTEMGGSSHVFIKQGTSHQVILETGTMLGLTNPHLGPT